MKYEEHALFGIFLLFFCQAYVRSISSPACRLSSRSDWIFFQWIHPRRILVHKLPNPRPLSLPSHYTIYPHVTSQKTKPSFLFQFRVALLPYSSTRRLQRQSGPNNVSLMGLNRAAVLVALVACVVSTVFVSTSALYRPGTAIYPR